MIIDSTYSTATNDYVDNKYEPSGIILISLITLNKQNKGIMEWNLNHQKLMGKYKSTVITSDGLHHGSKGNYCSYGNEANYGMIDLSSVSQYGHKKCSKLSQLKGLCIEELSQMEMQCGIKELSRHIPILPSVISPIVTTAHDMQNNIGNINIKETSSSKDGIW